MEGEQSSCTVTLGQKNPSSHRVWFALPAGQYMETPHAVAAVDPAPQ